MKRSLLLALCGAVAALTLASLSAAGNTPTKTTILAFKGTMSVAQAGHPKSVKPSTHGRFTATLNGSTLTWNIWFYNLSTIPANAYLGSGSKTLMQLCKNCSTTTAYAPGKTTGSGRGHAVLTKQQIDMLVAGKAWIKVSTPVNPSGEIRGLVARS